LSGLVRTVLSHRFDRVEIAVEASSKSRCRFTDPLQAHPNLIQLALNLLSLCVLLLKPGDQLIFFLKGWCSTLLLKLMVAELGE